MVLLTFYSLAKPSLTTMILVKSPMPHFQLWQPIHLVCSSLNLHPQRIISPPHPPPNLLANGKLRNSSLVISVSTEVKNYHSQLHLIAVTRVLMCVGSVLDIHRNCCRVIRELAEENQILKSQIDFLLLEVQKLRAESIVSEAYVSSKLYLIFPVSLKRKDWRWLWTSRYIKNQH